MWFWSCTSSVHLVLYGEGVLRGFGVETISIAVSILGSDFVLASKKSPLLSNLLAHKSVLREALFPVPPQPQHKIASMSLFCSFTVIFSTPFSEPLLEFIFKYIGTILGKCLR